MPAPEIAKALTAWKKKFAMTWRRAVLKQRWQNAKKIFTAFTKKWKKKLISFAEVEDIVGFRLIVKSRQECYISMGIMHESFTPNPSRFKDYVAIPKSNGYQSLHTSLITAVGLKVELQIRTRAMHEVAEHGLAAHWIYKQNKGGLNETQREALSRLSSLVRLHDENKAPGEFMEHVKVDLSPAEMYVLTPNGKILTLPLGATALDFAYRRSHRLGGPRRTRGH